jgi:hypothetical protein
MDVQKSGKIAANIHQLIDELARQVRKQSNEFTTEFRVVIDHSGAHVSQVTVGPEFLRYHGKKAVNVRGEAIEEK